MFWFNGIISFEGKRAWSTIADYTHISHAWGILPHFRFDPEMEGTSGRHPLHGTIADYNGDFLDKRLRKFAGDVLKKFDAGCAYA
ncbi:hypothetical protein KCP78_23000 [Salmonella enterica subsp. enterica]|nr:hypothetical protein KCP78_23000 [Salmonella enterica subsp. enterica]